MSAGLLPAFSQPDNDNTMDLISIANAQTASGGTAQSTLMNVLPILALFVIMYFVMIRPQMKRQKETRAMLDALSKGDEVVTSGGMVGRITKLGDNYLSLEVAAGVEVQLQRAAIVTVLPKGTLKNAN